MRKDTSRVIPNIPEGDSLHVRCAVRRAVVEFWKWFYTSPVAEKLVRRLGFAPLPSFITSKVLKKLIADIKCDGIQAYVENTLPSLPGFGTPVAIKPMELFTLTYTIIEPKTVIEYTDIHQILIKSGQEKIFGPIAMLNSIQKVLEASNTTVTAFALISSSPIFSLNSARPQDKTAAQLINDLMVQSWKIRGLFDESIDRKEVKKIEEQDENLIGFPLLAAVFVPVYTLDDSETKSISLTLEIIAEIMLGTITQWNDAKIQSLNPNYPLPPQAIVIVVEDDTSEKNLVLSTALCDASSAFREKISTPSPNFADKLDAITVLKVPNEKHTRATVIDQSGTLGIILVSGSNAGLRQASLQIKHNDDAIILASGRASIVPCLYHLAELRGWSTNNPVKESPCWPLSITIEMVMRRAHTKSSMLPQLTEQVQHINVEQICPLPHQLVAFTSWLFSDNEMGVPIQELNMADVASQNDLRGRVNVLMEEATCEGASLIAKYELCTPSDYIVRYSGCTKHNPKLSASFSWKQPKTCRRGVNLPRTVSDLKCGKSNMFDFKYPSLM